MPTPLPERSTIVITGVTGQVAEPLAVALAGAGHHVVGAARFRDTQARERLEASGVQCVPVNLATGDVADLPADAPYVCNFAVAKSNNWDTDLDANVGGVASLMEHHRRASAFLHCSSTAVYKPMGHHVFAEGDELGDNHGVWPFLRTYSIAKIAAEAAARWAARRFELPTTIARLSVPYGDGGGWPAIHLESMINARPIPVHANAPSIYHPLHEDDIIAMVPGLLNAASVPATVVNWGGDDAVSIEEWCGFLSELTGLSTEFAPTEHTIDSVDVDLTRMHALVGPTTVQWREGLARMVAARHPELLTRHEL
ncbi:MAG TPA: NAD(P)-dependent oxidoreductase [Acidimicrobiales bacterium]|nr:NAD(P)-dependent oxidoreductase [Acidimicrobiales bacterium]